MEVVGGLALKMRLEKDDRAPFGFNKKPKEESEKEDLHSAPNHIYYSYLTKVHDLFYYNENFEVRKLLTAPMIHTFLMIEEAGGPSLFLSCWCMFILCSKN